MSGVNPQGCQVFSFKQPSSDELEHDFLWRTTLCLPERGRIGIFSSYYEEVLPASIDNLQLFATEKELAKLAADWPASRLIEIWNSFAGVAPFDDLKAVKKFTSRNSAVARIEVMFRNCVGVAVAASPPADILRPAATSN
jgi:hypothetical protein